MNLVLVLVVVLVLELRIRGTKRAPGSWSQCAEPGGRAEAPPNPNGIASFSPALDDAVGLR
jgi:hypothetical protein